MSVKECNGVQYYNCPDFPTAEGPVGNSVTNTFTHNFDAKFEMNFGFKILPIIESHRTFTVTYSEDNTPHTDFMISVECGPMDTPPCYSSCTEWDSNVSAQISENYSIVKNDILYMDLRSNILFYRTVEETCVFSKSSTEPTEFKGKWGNSTHTKVILYNEEATILGTETFTLIFDGVETVLVENSYERYGSWEMAPIGIPTLDKGVIYVDEEPDPSIKQIFVIPQPASKSIPLDNEIRANGFYDYGSSSPAEPSELAEADGGKDYFFPSWIRGMEHNDILAELRKYRWDQYFNHIEPTGEHNVSSPPDIYYLTDVPKGNAVYDFIHGKMYAFTFRDRDGNQYSVSMLNGEAPTVKLIEDLGLDNYTNDWCFHPVSVL